MNFLTILLCVALRTEYLVNPEGIEVAHPRLQWRVESAERGQKQTAYWDLVAGTAATLARDEHCRRSEVPVGMAWLDEVHGYEKAVLSKRA